MSIFADFVRHLIVSGYRLRLDVRPPVDIPTTSRGPWFYKRCYNLEDDYESQGSD